ncbi:MAG: UDP-N-acetylmuramate dehydrogenase [Candidatus Eisenbacteria bacterium]|nr:UDP-N-acetylmuramate dehydrogenase [Candidatus Eisenbacteria bacterium]
MNIEIRDNMPLAPLTTFGIGGPARRFLNAESADAVRAGLEQARMNGWPVFLLGGGSNLLVSDSGFDGLVLRMALIGRGPAGSIDPCLRFPEVADHPQLRFVESGAGEDWDAFVAWAVAHDLGGLECLAGIPGTVGGTPVQNVGAYGQEVSSIIHQVRTLDRETGEIVVLENAECGFRYRESRFNTVDLDRWVVLSVVFALPVHALPTLTYRDVSEVFADRATPPSLTGVSQAVREIRRQKGMLLVDGDPDCRSAGSFFKNPRVSRDEADRLAGIVPAPLPLYPAGEGFVKVAAARLIEAAGFSRGHRRGGAAISSKHTLALTNAGAATAQDVVVLAREIRDAVRMKFGVTLVNEPVLVGFDEPL